MKAKVIDFSKPHIIHGVVQMLVSAFPLLVYARLLYQYHVGHILYFFMYPDRVLVLFMLMSMAGIVAGLLVYHKMLRARKGYLLILLLLIIGIAIDFAVLAASNM